MNLKDVTPSETSQSQKDKYCMISVLSGTLSRQIHRDRKQSGGRQGLGEGHGESVFTGFYFCKTERVLGVDGGDGHTAK